MSVHPIERRLREMSGSADAREVRAAKLLERLGPAPELSEIALFRVGARLNAPQHRKRSPVPALFKWAAIALALLCAAGAAAAIGPAVVKHLRALIATRIAPKASANNAPRILLETPAPAPTLMAPASANSISNDVSGAVRTPSAPHTNSAHSKLAAVAPGPSPEPKSTLMVETQELAAALALRRQGDLAGALNALEQFRVDHPRSTLIAESRFAELDTELALGQRDEALSLIDDLMSSGAAVPRAAELRVLRSELLSRAGRCDEALPGFDGALDSPSLGERARLGRANCLRVLGLGK